MRLAGRISWLRVMLFASAVTVGCGSGSSSRGSDCDGGCWQPTPADEQFLDGFCGALEPCCVRNAYRTQEDIETCKAHFRQIGFTRDESVRMACLAELQGLAASNDCVPELWNGDDPCVRTLVERSGPQQPGQPCAFHADCAGAAGAVTLCSPNPATNLIGAICVRAARGAAGDRTCLGAANVDGDITLAPFFRAGSTMPPISSGVYCARRDGLYCTPSDDPAARTCAPLVADGSTCEFPLSCASEKCLTASGGTASSSEPGTCATRVPAGQTCGGTGIICDDASTCATGTTGSTCAARVAAGSACSFDGMCTSANCDNALCSAQTHAERIALLNFCARF
jgi:hypothetical protein